MGGAPIVLLRNLREDWGARHWSASPRERVAQHEIQRAARLRRSPQVGRVRSNKASPRYHFFGSRRPAAVILQSGGREPELALKIIIMITITNVFTPTIVTTIVSSWLM